MTSKTSLTLVKIGGNILNDDAATKEVLDQFARIPETKILVHGGGRAATELAARLDVPQTMIEGRRVTDDETLKIAIMVYGGLINKSIVSGLQSRGVSALGIMGADLGLIRAKKRPANPVDYGFVGDIESVSLDKLLPLLSAGVTPVIAPLTHDGAGKILNTNADSIANALAAALSHHYEVRLVYSFERNGVEAGASGEVIRQITRSTFSSLKESGTVSGGMIPKLENAFSALDSGVSEVVIGNARALPALLAGETGTRICHE
ncbi:MAG: acetylglutamate kinase [Proteobacteria bacterium]|nr:acetylglutamate kinase [Pseudomonadota bacterium]